MKYKLKNLGNQDIRTTLNQWQNVLSLAWSDIQARYKRSALGPFWLVLGTSIAVLGLGLLWSSLLKIDKASFIPSLTAGLIIWQMISACLTEGASSLIRQANVIKNMKVPYFIHPLLIVFRNLVNFFHNILIFIIVIFIFSVPVSWITLLSIPGILIMSINLLWVILLFGIIGARFRDFEFLVTALVPLLFFISPVLYRPEYLPFNSIIVWMNPISYLIEIIRSPMLGIVPSKDVYLTIIGMTIVGWGITLTLFNFKYKRIAFWI